MDKLIKWLGLACIVAFLCYLIVSTLLVILPLLALVFGIGTALGLLVFLTTIVAKLKRQKP